MTVDGEEVKEMSETTESEEVLQEGLVENQETKEQKGGVAVIVMFALTGAYFAFEWLSSLLIGLRIL